MRFWRHCQAALIHQTRRLCITCRGRPLARGKLFEYTNGRFLVNEAHAIGRRFLEFNVEELCAIASTVGTASPVCSIEKMEGGFSRALLLKKSDSSELVAKLPFSIAGPPKYTTAAEVAVLQYGKLNALKSVCSADSLPPVVHQHTTVPVTKVLAWNPDASNPVGAEYIIMEKAAGTQLVKMWSKMSDYDHFALIKTLAALMSELATVKFPANGALYLRASMNHEDEHIPLQSEIDPTARFCIGPSCERNWLGGDVMRHINKPWPDCSSFGRALVTREKARVERHPNPSAADADLHGSQEEKLAGLRLAAEVMGRMAPASFPGKFSSPTLWHTDLHLGNIYVSEKDPTQVVSLIDWQGIVISPLLCQVRFPSFLTVRDDYQYGERVARLPENIDGMAEGEQQVLRFMHKQHCMAKIYEAATGLENLHIYHALGMPSLFRELFVRSGEVWEEGVIPLRECLIDIAQAWEDAEFPGQCAISFSEEELARHQSQFQEYTNFHCVQKIAKEFLGTDSEGWIFSGEDFEQKQQQNRELRKAVMADCASYGRTAEQIQAIWPS